VKNVANQFQKSSDAQGKGDREMSVCEMQREVDRNTQELKQARDEFVRTVTIAKQSGARLDPAILKTDTKIPQGPSLGRTYCTLLRKLKIPALGAQEPVQTPTQRPVRAPAPARRAVTPQQHPVQRPVVPPRAVPPPSRVAPRVAPRVPPHVPPQGRIAPMPFPHPPPYTMSPTMVEVTKLRMSDARSSIADFQVEIHKKFALAVACFIFVMLGAPIALRFPRGGVGLTIGVSLFVFALYYVGLIAGESLAKHEIVPAAISMWSANGIFGIVALVLLVRMGRESGSARGGGEFGDRVRQWMRTILRRERRRTA